MTTQPEALRLADGLDVLIKETGFADGNIAKTAAELRRLHESNQELLAALKALIDAEAPDYIKSSIWNKARAAIAKAEGEAK